MLEAVATAAARAECEVLIIARGGGSLEDLWAFNDEQLARALRALPMPVVSGIGHEIDFTIADFVADLRAPTPSGAAELVVPDATAWRTSLARLAARFAQSMQRQLRDDAEALRALNRRLALAHPGQRLRQGAQRLDDLEQRLGSQILLHLAEARGRLARASAGLTQVSPARELARQVQRHAALDARLRQSLPRLLTQRRQAFELAKRTLDAVSPLATLDRGFAIVTRRSDGRLIRDSGELARGETIEARLGRGRVRAQVTDVAEGEFES